MCCGWVPCFLASCPFRSRDEFFVVVRSYSIYQFERFTRSNDVLTLDNVYIPLFVRIAWSCQMYISLVVRIGWFRPYKFTSGFAPYNVVVGKSEVPAMAWPLRRMLTIAGQDSPAQQLKFWNTLKESVYCS